MSREKNRKEFEFRFQLPDGMRWCSTSQQYTGHKDFWLWNDRFNTWQASREVLVIELPQQSGANLDWNQAIRYCHQAIEAAGVKVKL